MNILQKTLQDHENALIINWQNKYEDEEVLHTFAIWSQELSDYLFTMAMQILFFFYGDCLIAFKSSVVWLMGYYCILVLKLLYAWPRPFWVDSQVSTSRCDIMFSLPNSQIFNQMFYWNYQIYTLL